MLLNLVALGLVLGLSWVGMMWLAKRVHRQQGRSAEDTEWAITRIDEAPAASISAEIADQNTGKVSQDVQAELDALFKALHDTRPAEPVEFP